MSWKKIPLRGVLTLVIDEWGPYGEPITVGRVTVSGAPELRIAEDLFGSVDN